MIGNAFVHGMKILHKMKDKLPENYFDDNYKKATSGTGYNIDAKIVGYLFRVKFHNHTYRYLQGQISK